MIVVNQNGNLVVETNKLWYKENSIYCMSSSEEICLATYEDETSTFCEFDGFLETLKNGSNYYEFKPMEDYSDEEIFKNPFGEANQFKSYSTDKVGCWKDTRK